MQEYKNIRIIGIDHGYGNIKTANTVTPTGVQIFDIAPTFEGNVLLYEGKYYRLLRLNAAAINAFRKRKALRLSACG